MVNGKRGRGRKICGWLGNVSRYAGMNMNIKQMRRNYYQQGRMEDHSIQRRVQQGTAVR